MLMNSTEPRVRSMGRSVRSVAAMMALSAVLCGCGGTPVAEIPDATVAASTTVMAPVTTVPVTTTTEPPEPVMERMVRTLPASGSEGDLPIRNAAFQRFDSLRHTEVGQTLEVTESFELHRISVWFAGPTIALEGFRDVYFDGIDWSRVEPYVRNPGVVEDLAISLSIVLYRSPYSDRFPTEVRRTSGFGGVPLRDREVIVVRELEVISDQPLLGRVTAGFVASDLDLSDPVLMQPGRWLVALRMDRGADDIDIIDLPLVGWESGRSPDVVIPDDQSCSYIPVDDPTPEFAFFWREGDQGDVFIPGFAKVQACLEIGRYNNPLGTGDVALDLWGFPID